MFIAPVASSPPAPFGGAEFNFAGTRQGTFRPSARRGVGRRVVYKHSPQTGLQTAL